MKRSLALLALATAGLAGCVDESPTAATRPSAPTATPDYGVASYMPGRVIVRFASSTVNARLGRAEREAGARRGIEGVSARVQEELRLPRTFVLSVQPGQEEEVAAQLSQEEGVEFAEPDYMIELIPCETGDCNDPADFMLFRKWDLHNTGSITVGATTTATGKADADIDWIEAFHALGATPGGTATIGIIDTGIRASHQDLAGRVVAARNFASGYPATLTDDRDGHGTHVAGIAAGGGVAASGVAYHSGIKLINAKACERYLFPDGIVRTSCPTSSTANAIVWAVDQGADVLNLSLGGSPLATSGSALQQAALQYARANDVLPFCATGNDNYGAIAFPARFDECIGVGATNWADARASYSNYGTGTEITAPGGDGGAGFPLGLILSLSNSADNLYTYKAGTSMATPQVVGLAALLTAHGVGDDEAVLARMKATADDLGAAGTDEVFGAGRINVCRALNPKQVQVTMPGAFNRGSNGVFTVVIYSEVAAGAQTAGMGIMHAGHEHARGFDAAMMDEAQITVGDGTGAGAGIALRGDAFRSSLVDVDGDGDLDLEIKISRPELAAAVASGTTRLFVRGNVGCRRIEGSAAVKVNG